jgi:hypothetical protein
VLSADENQNAGDNREDCWDDTETEPREANQADADEINCEDEHSEIFGDSHGSFLRQTRSLCTLKRVLVERLGLLHPATHGDLTAMAVDPNRQRQTQA